MHSLNSHLTKLTIILVLVSPSVVADKLTYDPFVPVKVEKVTIVTPVSTPQVVVKKEEKEWTATLLSIIEAGSDSIANVDGNFITIGESYKEYKLIKVNKNSVVFEKDNHKISLNIEE